MSRYRFGISNRLSRLFLKQAMALTPQTSPTRTRKLLRTLRVIRVS